MEAYAARRKAECDEALRRQVASRGYRAPYPEANPQVVGDTFPCSGWNLGTLRSLGTHPRPWLIRDQRAFTMRWVRGGSARSAIKGGEALICVSRLETDFHQFTKRVYQ